MALHHKLYTVRTDNMFAGAVTSGPQPRSYVIAFEHQNHVQKYCRTILFPHKVVVRNKKTIVIAPVTNKKNSKANGAFPPVDLYNLEVEEVPTAELLAYVYEKNSRLFMVNRVHQEQTKNITILTTDTDPMSISIDKDLVIGNLIDIYENETAVNRSDSLSHGDEDDYQY